MLTNLFIIQGMPRLPRRQLAALRPPMSAILAHHRKQCLPNLIQYENTRLLNRMLLIATVKHQDFRKGSQQVLLHTTDFLAFLAFPRSILPWIHCGLNGVRDTLGLLRRQGEFQHTFANQIGLVAVQASNAGAKLKSQELVQPRNLVTQCHQKFMAIPDILAGWQIFGANRLVELRKTVAVRIEDLLQSQINRSILRIQLILPLLQLRNPKESLKSRIDPTGSFHVSQAEHLTLTKRTC
jgi:hypothetical protein